MALDRVNITIGQVPTEADLEDWFNRAIDKLNTGIAVSDLILDGSGKLAVSITGDAGTLNGLTAAQIVAGDFPDVKKTLIDMIVGTARNGVVLSGGVATKNGTTATQLDITAIKVVQKVTATGYIDRVEIAATNKSVAATNATYYLAVEDGASDYYWSTTAPTGDYVNVATVTTDGSGNISTVTDTRPITSKLFDGMGLTMNPVAHKSTHATGGSDVLTPSDIGAYTKTEVETKVNELLGYGVYSGCKVTAQLTPDMTVDVAAGTVYLPSGKRYAISSVDKTVTAAHATLARKDIVYVDSAGAVQYAAGTADASPAEPSLPSGAVKLAVIDVPAADTTIENAQITDSRWGCRVSFGTTAPSTPIKGERFFDFTNNLWKFYDGTQWTTFLTDTTTPDKVFRIGHTYSISGQIYVPSGDSDYIPPFFISLASGQTAKLVKARHRINSGTSVTCDLTKNGSNITGFTSISVTTTTADTDPADVTLADNDMIALVVTAVSDTPKNMTFTIFIEYTQ